jgi:hypothetical protein
MLAVLESFPKLWEAFPLQSFGKLWKAFQNGEAREQVSGTVSFIMHRETAPRGGPR